MNGRPGTLLKLEFEARIFVSLGIVALVCAASGAMIARSQPLLMVLGSLVGLHSSAALRAGFTGIALVMGGVSLLRMWAGTELTALRVMAFRVQTDQLSMSGPYMLVRNPIYLADFLAMCAFALCLPPVGLAMPVLFLFHYVRLIRYEEISLGAGFEAQYQSYAASVPRLLPTVRSFVSLPHAVRGFRLSAEGVRHNALYLLFIPGFVAAAITGEFLYAVVIGLPGVVDWAIIHTRIGVRR